MNTSLILVFLVSTCIAFFSTPLVIKFAYKLGIVDDPAKNKHPKVIHTYPVPRGGGLASFVAIFLASLLFLPLDAHLKAILLGAFLITIMGLLDDLYNLSPYFRLLLEIIIAIIPIAAGIGITFTTHPFGTGILNLSNPSISFNFLGELRQINLIADAFAVFWIIFLMNMINMGAKGVDGQLPGVAGIAALTISILSFKFSADITQWPVTVLALITAGAFLGFLPWNAYPQKIMPSYSGSTLAGYMLGILSILSTAKVGTLLVVLGIPIVDTTYTIVRRILSGKSPVWGDRGHLHHKLYDIGWSKRQISFFYWGSTSLLAFLALRLNAQNKLYTIIGIALIVGGLLIWLTKNLRKK